MRAAGRRVLAFLGAALLSGSGGCRPNSPTVSGTPPNSAPIASTNAVRSTPAVNSPIHFVDVTDRTGVHFLHVSGFTEERLAPVANGSGVGAFDYDGDGILDLFFITGQPIRTNATSRVPTHALYRGLGDLQFEDATEMSGLPGADAGYGHGVTVGDFDNDGFPDVYLTCFGLSRLFQNHGDGTFAEVTTPSGTGHRDWSASAAWFDADEDGTLDLYVCHYAEWSLEEHPFCGDQERNLRMFCAPTRLPPRPHALFMNQGDGTFREATEQAGIRRTDGRGLGVVAADLNLDGHLDLFVANDLCPNFLFLGNGDGTFRDVTEISGSALDAAGRMLSGMGVDAEDVTEDGLPDMFVTTFWMQHKPLYRNMSHDQFIDVGESSGISAASRRYVGWGTRLQDFDNDGLPDVFVANGHVDDNMPNFDIDSPYRQPAQLWVNRGKGQFEHVSTESGSYFRTLHVSRGAAFADLDNDGWMDIVVSQCDEAPAILRNRSNERSADQPNGWVRVELVGVRSNRDAIGARVIAKTSEREITQQLRGGSSYLSAHDLRLLIGLGNSPQLDRLKIQWPGGTTTEKETTPPDQSIRVRESRER